MPLALLVAGLVLVLLNDDLWPTGLLKNLSDDLYLSQGFLVGSDLVAVDQENSWQLNGARSCCNAVHGDDGAHLNLFLATASTNNCVNHFETYL